MPTKNQKASRIWKSRCDAKFEYSMTLDEIYLSINATQWKRQNKKRRTCGTICSKHYSESKMRHLARVSFGSILLISLVTSLFAAPKKEYFTEDEIDLI